MRFPAGDSVVVGLSGPDGTATFWLSPPTGNETRELHVAFRAPDRAAVDAVHEAAVAAGVEVLHAPREWPEYHPGYYAVFLRDPDGQPTFWLGPPTGNETRELHVAFRAPDRAAVDAVHEAAVASGVEVLHAPREWPEYHPGYYAVFLRDPDGHNVEAVHHG